MGWESSYGIPSDRSQLLSIRLVASPSDCEQEEGDSHDAYVRTWFVQYVPKTRAGDLAFEQVCRPNVRYFGVFEGPLPSARPLARIHAGIRCNGRHLV